MPLPSLGWRSPDLSHVFRLTDTSLSFPWMRHVLPVGSWSGTIILLPANLNFFEVGLKCFFLTRRFALRSSSNPPCRNCAVLYSPARKNFRFGWRVSTQTCSNPQSPPHPTFTTIRRGDCDHTLQRLMLCLSLNRLGDRGCRALQILGPRDFCLRPSFFLSVSPPLSIPLTCYDLLLFSRLVVMRPG